MELHHNGESVVTVIEFPSTGAAKKYITPENLRKELQGLEIEVVEEKGLGDRAFVLTQEEGWTLSWLKGSKYLAVTMSGALSSADRVKGSQEARRLTGGETLIRCSECHAKRERRLGTKRHR